MNIDSLFEMVTIDVSQLPAPEPMTKIIQALASLTPKQFLQVCHRREPFPLYEKLGAAGWLYYCHQNTQDDFHIYIYKVSQHEYIAQLVNIKYNG